MSSAWSSVVLCAVVAATSFSAATAAAAQPFNRRAEIECHPNRASCKGPIDIPEGDGTVISFVSCWLSYTGEVHAQLNITRAGEESGFFTLMTPTGGSLVKVISQSVSIHVPRSSGTFIVFDFFGGQVQQPPSCVVSGFSD